MGVTGAGIAMDSFGVMIRAQRQRLGLSLTVFAQRAEMDRSYLVRIEHGDKASTSVGREIVGRIVRGLRLPRAEADRMLAACDRPPEVVTRCGWDPIAGDVLEVLAGLPEAQRDGCRVALARIVKWYREEGGS